MTSCIDFDLAMLQPSDTAYTIVAHRVTPGDSVKGKGRWVRQMCCGDNFGMVEICLEPYCRRSQFQLVWQVRQEQIPEEFLPGVMEGIRQAILQGRLGAGQLTALRIIIVGGASHPVDSGP